MGAGVPPPREGDVFSLTPDLPGREGTEGRWVSFYYSYYCFGHKVGGRIVGLGEGVCLFWAKRGPDGSASYGKRGEGNNRKPHLGGKKTELPFKNKKLLLQGNLRALPDGAPKSPCLAFFTGGVGGGAASLISAPLPFPK